MTSEQPETQERWARLKSFVAAWHRPIAAGDGLPAEEVDKAEQWLGVKLPQALCEWYRLAGRRADLTAHQNFLLPPDALALEPVAPRRLPGAVKEQILIFHVENQNVVQWGIRLRDFALPDPPVVLNDGGWEIENQHVSEFALQMVVFETIITCRYTSWGWAKRGVLESIERTFENMGFPDWHWPGDEKNRTRFYSRPGVLVMTTELIDAEEGHEVWLATRMAELHEQVRSDLNVEWEYRWDHA